MDANKLRALRGLGYEIRRCCEFCRHADLSPDGWGKCGLHAYSHLKHAEDRRQLSIHRSGSCSAWERDEGRVAALRAYGEFLAPGEDEC